MRTDLDDFDVRSLVQELQARNAIDVVLEDISSKELCDIIADRGEHYDLLSTYDDDPLIDALTSRGFAVYDSKALDSPDTALYELFLKLSVGKVPTKQDFNSVFEPILGKTL